MTEARWTRIAGLCVLAALALQGAGALQHAQDSGLQDCWALCHLPLVAPDLPAGTPPDLADAGLVADGTPPAVSAAPASPHPSRGPPA